MTDHVQIFAERRDKHLLPLTRKIEHYISSLLTEATVERFDNVSSRVKTVASFEKKARAEENGMPKYAAPLTSIQDQIGVRVTVFYNSDISIVESVVRRHCRLIELKELIPDSAWSFGYFGKHMLPLIPTHLIPEGVEEDEIPPCFELQIKTLFQHAWAQANHDLGYKPELGGLSPDEERKLAFASAQAWGADHHFNELFLEKREKAMAH